MERSKNFLGHRTLSNECILEPLWTKFSAVFMAPPDISLNRRTGSRNRSSKFSSAVITPNVKVNYEQVDLNHKIKSSTPRSIRFPPDDPFSTYMLLLSAPTCLFACQISLYMYTQYAHIRNMYITRYPTNPNGHKANKLLLSVQ